MGQMFKHSNRLLNSSSIMGYLIQTRNGLRAAAATGPTSQVLFLKLGRNNLAKAAAIYLREIAGVSSSPAELNDLVQRFSIVLGGGITGVTWDLDAALALKGAPAVLRVLLGKRRAAAGVDAKIAGAQNRETAELLDEAALKLEQYIQHSTFKKHKPATVVGAIDPLTGKIATTSNGVVPSTIAPELQAYADSLGGLGVKTACGNTLGRCAEFRAANELLLSNPKLRLDDINSLPPFVLEQEKWFHAAKTVQISLEQNNGDG